MKNTVIAWVFAAIIVIGVSAPASADTLNLVVQPAYTSDRAQEVYAPLVEYLNRATTHEVNLVTTRNFHHYWSQMRKADNGWDLVFDDAHFTDYRIQKYGYRPLVRTAEPVTFSVLAGPQIMDLELDSLVGRRVVTMPAPSLGFAVVTQWFDNPLAQPILVSSASSWRDTVEIVFADEGDAAIVPAWLGERYPNLPAIATSSEMPGAAISASPNVSQETAQEIKDALLKLHEDDGLYEVLAELNITQFDSATAQEYAGQSDILKDFFGY